MAHGLNKVMLIGYLGADPETKYMPNGDAVTNLRIATAESWTDKSSGQRQERTEWHRVVMFKKLAEIAGEYLHKGSQIYIEGSLRTRKWQDKEGKDQYTTEIIGKSLQMLGGGKEKDAAERKAGPNKPAEASAVAGPKFVPADDDPFADDEDILF